MLSGKKSIPWPMTQNGYPRTMITFWCMPQIKRYGDRTDFRGVCLAPRSKHAAQDATEGVAEVTECVGGQVVESLDDGAGDRLRLGAGLGAVAAPDFAVDDRRLQGLFAAVIGGGDCRVEQEREPGGRMIRQVLGEAGVG